MPVAIQPIAIIFPHEGHLRAALSDVDARPSLGDLCYLCMDQNVKALVLKDCNAAGKRSGFKKGIEFLQAVVLTGG